ncbi:consortin-like [Cyprinodon tularosa]|uniref:consortin-like n=1 Tax=Cyprinodon tularosa TaxID=77115 RepID=UPI0018E22ADA|nr:consortin-like [Cyprinodon tularosa]
MDHGLFEMEGSAMSQVGVDGFELCDNISDSEALTAQTRNLNQTLAQTLPIPQNEEAGSCCPIQKTPLDNSREEETGKEEHSEESRDVDEEEDVDEMMKEEEEEESEASSSLICCQSPDTPMTDSSYSETGSLLETPYPFSPGTSPEPTSPVIPLIIPDSFELHQSCTEVISSTTKSGLVHCRTEATAVGLSSNIMTSGIQPDSSSIGNTTASDTILKDSFSEQLTSPEEPVSSCGPTGPLCLGGLDTSTDSASQIVSADTSAVTTGSKSTATEFTSSLLSDSSHQNEFISTTVPDSSLVSTCSTGSILGPTFLESLEELAERNDGRLPHYLHQIAETFVLQKDYQRALLFLQLEQLYHQRLLENLNALQQQWVSQCGGTSPELAASQLDSLKHLCQTHTRPRTRDAEVTLQDNLRLKFDGGVSQLSCISSLQVKGEMEERAEDSSSPTTTSACLLTRLSLPDTDGEDLNGKSEGRDTFYGSDLTRLQARSREVEGGEEDTISTGGNGLHPSTAGGMDRSDPAEQQEEDLGLSGEGERKVEEEDKSEVEEAAEALEMEDEGTEDDGEDMQSKGDSHLLEGAPSVETLVSGAEWQLHRDTSAKEKLHVQQQTQEDTGTYLKEQEALPSKEADMERQQRYAEESEEEEEYDGDFLRRTPSLDDKAKLITVEEVSPASGLVSILKKRSVYVDSLESAGPEPGPEKPTAKRRVRFTVPDDSYDQEVGGGDSCLLLFLLCLVTVVISIGGTALYCALGDAQSSVCQDFSRNIDFYILQMRRGLAQLQHWYTSGL